MDKFENQLEGMDVQTAYVEEIISGVTSITAPTEEVDLLITQVAQEHNLDVLVQVGAVSVPRTAPLVEQGEVDQLAARLQRLMAKA